MRTLLAAPLALAGSFYLGFLDRHTDDTGIILGLHVLLNVALGFAMRRRAWLWPVLTVPGIPVMNFLGPEHPGLPHTPGSFLLLSFVLSAAGAAGSATGALLRAAIHPPSVPSER